MTQPDHGVWTLVGSLGAPGQTDAPRGAVDPVGTVTPGPRGWSLEWWVGADDRWHVPRNEAAVRQRLIDDAPVIETAMRVPGGDARQRVFGVVDRTGGHALVVEIENASPVPFALALALHPTAAADRVSEIKLDGHILVVNGQPSLVLPRPPSRTATGSTGSRDSADVVFTGDAVATSDLHVACPHGGAQAVLIYPVAHRAVFRLAILLPPTSSDTSVTPGALPSADQVASGWSAQTQRGARLDVPPGRLHEAFEANRRFLLLAASGSGGFGEQDGRRDRALVAMALDHLGFGDEAGTTLASMPEGADLHGGDGDGVALVAIAQHLQLTDDEALLHALLPTIAVSAGRLRTRVSHAPRRPAAPKTAHAPRPHPDAPWTRRGLLAAAELFERAGESTAAANARRDAARVRQGDSQDHEVPTRDPESIFAEIAEGRTERSRSSADELLDAGLGAASATWSWPDPAASPPGEVGLTAQHLPTAAAFVRAVIALVVRETDDGIAVLPTLPPAWTGHELHVRGVPTRFGRLSYALRWHGERPALLWELESEQPPPSSFALTAAGVDPAWVGSGPRGEALLGPVAGNRIAGEPATDVRAGESFR